MPMQVPTFTDAMDQVKSTDLPSARFTTQANPDAFGAGPAQAKFQQASMTTMGDAVQAFKEQKDRANQIKHIQDFTQLSQLNTNIKTQVSQMKGQDAFAAPDIAKQMWSDGISGIQDSLVGQDQKLNFAKTAADQWDDLNKSVQMHVTSESQNFDDQTTQAGIDQARNAAVVNAGDDEQVAKNLDVQKQLIDGWAERKGIPADSDIYKNKLSAEQSATHLGVIHQRLQSGMDDAAQEYYDGHKDGMSAADVEHAESALDASKVVGESSDQFDKIIADPNFKYSDGSLNLEKIRGQVMDQAKEDGISDQHALRILTQVRAMGNEYNRDRYHKISANERSFANEVIQAKQSGQSLQDALKLAPKWGYDSYDIAQKQSYVQKSYEPPTEDQPIAHEQLREGIQDGTVELADIDRAKDQGQISAQAWANLRQVKLKTAADGSDPAAKRTDAMIKDLAQQKIGNDKNSMAQFMYAVGQKAQGKSPDEKMVIAKQELENAPDPKAGFFSKLFGGGSRPQYQMDAEAAQGQQTAQGAIYADLGYKQVQAVASGMSGGGFQKEQNPEAHLQAFANDLGVKYEDLKVGQPANNAIISLHNKGKLVTPDTVRQVLAKHPDGKWGW